MATIYTDTNNFTGSVSARMWKDPLTWQGGIVPTSSDTVYIRGIRTTTNQAAINAWTGSINITVTSNVGFPTSGSFYTVTDRGMKLKIDYTGKTSTTRFDSCSIDSTYFPFTQSTFPDRFGGTIFNGSYVHFVPTIMVTGSISASCLIGIVEYGGYLKIFNSGTYYVGNYLTVRDGTLHASESAVFRYNYHNTSQTTGEISRIVGEDYRLSHIIFEAQDTRSRTKISANVPIGSYYISCSNASTLFAKGDRIAITNNDNRFVMTYDITNRDYASEPLYQNEEGLFVGETDSNGIYVYLVNKMSSKILSSSADNEIIVDETRWRIGDKILVGSQSFVITNVEDYDYPLRSYDFSTGATLADWETDVTRSAYFANFTVSSSYALIQHSSTAYRHLFIKDIMRGEVKINAWMSNYRGITGGTSDGGVLGITFHSSPVLDSDYGNSSSGRAYFGWNVDNNRYYLYNYNMTNYTNHRLTSGSISNYGLKKLTVDCRKGFIKGYIDDKLVVENILRQPPYIGRVGIFCENQNSFSCTKFEVFAPSQKLTLNTSGIFSASMMVYETGTEYSHSIGEDIIKLSSVITDAMGHKNLAYAFRGMEQFENNNIYPYMYSVNTLTRNSNTSNWYMLVNNCHSSYYYDLGIGTNKYWVVDLTTQSNFTHISYKERYRTYGQRLNYFDVSGSNDMTTWTPLYGTGSVLERKSNWDALRLFDLGGTKSFRFVKVGVANGTSFGTENAGIHLGVHDFSDGFKIKVNNTSDFNINDKVTILYEGGFSADTEETYMTYTATGTESTDGFVTKIRNDYIIVAKNGNELTLDRPFINGPLRGGEQIVKLNRNIIVSGSRTPSMWSLGRFWLNVGNSYGRRYEIRNTEFSYMSSYYPTNRRNYPNANFAPLSYNLYDHLLFDGISMYSTYAGDTTYGWSNYNTANFFMKNSFISSISGRGWGAYYPQPYASGHYQVNNILAQNYFTGVYGYTEYFRGYYNVSYNQMITNNGPGFSAGTGTLQSYSQTYSFYKKILYRNYCNGIVGNYHTIYYDSRADGVVSWSDFKNNTSNYTFGLFLYVFGNQVQYLDGNNMILQKECRLDDRLTNWRNAGIMYNEYAEIPNIIPWIKNWNRLNYNLGSFFPYFVVKYPNEDSFRFYGLDADYRSPMIGCFIYSNTNKLINVTIEFSFKSDISNYTCDEGTNQCRLTFIQLKNNTRYANDVIFNKSLEWQTYKVKIPISSPGGYSFYVGANYRDGYIAFKNLSTTINTTATNNDEYFVTKNTFDMQLLNNPFTYMRKDSSQRTDSKLRLNGGRL